MLSTSAGRLFRRGRVMSLTKRLQLQLHLLLPRPQLSSFVTRRVSPAYRKWRLYPATYSLDGTQTCRCLAVAATGRQHHVSPPKAALTPSSRKHSTYLSIDNSAFRHRLRFWRRPPRWRPGGGWPGCRSRAVTSRFRLMLSFGCTGRPIQSPSTSSTTTIPTTFTPSRTSLLLWCSPICRVLCSKAAGASTFGTARMATSGGLLTTTWKAWSREWAMGSKAIGSFGTTSVSYQKMQWNSQHVL